MKVIRLDDVVHLCPICGQTIITTADVSTLSDGSVAHIDCAKYWERWISDGRTGFTEPSVTGSCGYEKQKEDDVW